MFITALTAIPKSGFKLCCFGNNSSKTPSLMPFRWHKPLYRHRNFFFSSCQQLFNFIQTPWFPWDIRRAIPWREANKIPFSSSIHERVHLLSSVSLQSHNKTMTKTQIPATKLLGLLSDERFSRLKTDTVLGQALVFETDPIIAKILLAKFNKFFRCALIALGTTEGAPWPTIANKWAFASTQYRGSSRASVAESAVRGLSWLKNRNSISKATNLWPLISSDPSLPTSHTNIAEHHSQHKMNSISLPIKNLPAHFYGN